MLLLLRKFNISRAEKLPKNYKALKYILSLPYNNSDYIRSGKI